MSPGEYISGLISLTAAASLITLLLPREGTLRSAVCAALTLAVLCAVLSPAAGVIRRIGDGLQNGRYELPRTDASDIPGGALYDALSRQSREEIGQALTEAVCSAFDLSADEVRVTVSVRADENGVSVEAVTAELTGRGVTVDPAELRLLTQKLCGVSCEVVTGRKRSEDRPSVQTEAP